jgi:hypothetical protein
MKFNVLSGTPQVTTNHEQAKAYKVSPEMELYIAVVTASLSDTFYEKEGSRLKRIIELVSKVDARFVTQLAVYARKKMHLRSIPAVLAVELAKVHSGDNLVQRMVSGIIQRADEITEILAYYQQANARTGVKKLNKLSKQLQKGIALAFNSFDEYQFAKYDRETAVSLKDALFLVHPKAKDELQQSVFDKIVNDTLTVPYGNCRLKNLPIPAMCWNVWKKPW